MEKIQARDIEKIEEELYEIIDMLEELDAKRDTLRIGIIQSASEAVANAEITEEEDMSEDYIDELDSFEDELDEATNHIRHALDIVGDKLPGLQRRLMRHPINPVYDAQLS
tara:strand:+ start:971 stop:1303 length:333 start_codon:yes stop_codon:yes gene_type:complete